MISNSEQEKVINFVSATRNHGTVETMVDDKTCKKCSKRVDMRTDLFTVCEGECACFYHAACVNLTEDVLQILSGNIIWICDQCMIQFQRTRGNIRPNSHSDVFTAKSIEEEVIELKNTVAGIVQTLSSIVPANQLNTTVPRHSTPKSTHAPSNGTCISSVNANCDESQRSPCAPIDTDFSLFLSNIDASVTEWDVHQLVARSLGTTDPEPIDVVKLTSNWSGRRALDFVSFKVVLDRKYKDRAMNPSTWPVNVKFREFVKRSSNTWKPRWSPQEL